MKKKKYKSHKNYYKLKESFFGLQHILTQAYSNNEAEVHFNRIVVLFIPVTRRVKG